MVPDLYYVVASIVESIIHVVVFLVFMRVAATPADAN